MSFQNKPGKTKAWRKMVIRQQVSDVLAYGRIITTKTKAKETRRHVDHLITLGKKNTLASRRAAAAILLNTKDYNVDQLLKKLFDTLAPGFATRNGGYTRVLLLGTRNGDNTEQAILELVETKKVAKAEPKKEVKVIASQDDSKKDSSKSACKCSSKLATSKTSKSVAKKPAANTKCSAKKESSTIKK